MTQRHFRNRKALPENEVNVFQVAMVNVKKIILNRTLSMDSLSKFMLD